MEKANVYDFMAGNPPYGGSLAWEPWMNDKFDIKVRNSVALILQLYLHKLKNGGRCGMVVDQGILKNGNNKKNAWEKNMRQKLLVQNDLYKVILLPTGIFAHTNFATAIIFFVKGGCSKQVEFIEGYFKDDDKGKSNKQMHMNQGIVVDIEKIKATGWSLDLGDYVDKPSEDRTGRVRLGDIVKFTRGASITMEKLTPGAYKVIGGGYALTDKTHNEYNCDENTIIMSGDGAYAGYLNRINEKIFITNHCNKMALLDDTRYTKDYVYYYMKINFQSRLITRGNDGYQKGQAQPAIDLPKMYDEIHIPAIPMARQNELVSFLDTIYTQYKIEDTVKYMSGVNLFGLLLSKQYSEFERVIWYQERIPRTMDDLAQVAGMRNDYIRGLFNTVASKKYKMNEIASINKHTCTDDTLKQLEYINYIDISSIENNIITKTTRLTDEYPCRARRMPVKGDVIVSSVRPNLRKIALVRDESDNTVASSGFHVLTCGAIVINKYLMMYMLTDEATNYLVKNSSGNAYPAFNKCVIENMPIRVPSLTDQQKIIAEIDRITSDQSAYAKYATILQEQIDLMNTTITNICASNPFDPDQSDPDQSDPDQSDPDQSDPDQSDPDQSDPDQSDPDQSDPDQSDQPKRSRKKPIQPDTKPRKQTGTKKTKSTKKASRGPNDDTHVPIATKPTKKPTRKSDSADSIKPTKAKKIVKPISQDADDIEPEPPRSTKIERVASAKKPTVAKKVTKIRVVRNPES
jgi:restriction endonuclease S subunit